LYSPRREDGTREAKLVNLKRVISGRTEGRNTNEEYKNAKLQRIKNGGINAIPK
jgi:hypothetical protein